MDAALAAIDGQAVVTPLFTWLGQSLVFGTALAGVTWFVARALRRRLRATIETALWTIVLLKFLVPIGPAWSLSFTNLVPAVPLRAERVGSDEYTASTTPPAVPIASPAASTGSCGAEAARSNSPAWPTLLGAAYLAVVMSLAAVRLRSYQSLKARCLALAPGDEPTRRLVQQVCCRLRVRRMPSVRVGDMRRVPFVMGLFRPLLVLPASGPTCRDELETIVVHEVAHLRRGDMIVRYVQWAATVLLFFWPVVAWVNRRIDLARECACDEWALRQGKLSAPRYARCLLDAAQRPYSSPLAYHPCSMGADRKLIVRRIDMILSSPVAAITQPRRRVPAVVCLAAWGCFSLTGTVGAADRTIAQPRSATEEAVATRAAEVYEQVARHAGADIDGDGIVSYREKTAYLIGLLIDQAEPFMVEFPYADRDHSGKVDYWEAHDALRGVTLVAYADRRPDAASGAQLDLEFYHMALDAQQWLLDNMKHEPTADLDNIKAVVMSLSTRSADHMRKLDHGAPVRSDAGKGRLAERSRFAELENGIAAIEVKLASENDRVRVAELRAMLGKLEVLLAKLNGRN